MDERKFSIQDALIKDDFCIYKYLTIEGIGTGDKHKVDGAGIIDNDMRTAFSRLAVHLAFIDDVFKHSKIEVDDIDKFHADELTQLYTVKGFKVTGDHENESVVILGTKYVSGGGRIALETPKVTLDSSSSYKWYNELKTALDQAREEVALYREGKYTKVEEEDEPIKPLKQTKLKFSVTSKAEFDEEFENAEV